MNLKKRIIEGWTTLRIVKASQWLVQDAEDHECDQFLAGIRVNGNNRLSKVKINNSDSLYEIKVNKKDNDETLLKTKGWGPSGLISTAKIELRSSDDSCYGYQYELFPSKESLIRSLPEIHKNEEPIFVEMNISLA